eukprot:g3318.t1
MESRGHDDELEVIEATLGQVRNERAELSGTGIEPWRQAMPNGPLRDRWIMTKCGSQRGCLPCNWLLHVPRKLVSKKKRRYEADGFDLDLVYLMPRVIVMGFPAVGVEHLFRNPRSETRRFLDTKHAGHYKVFNFCCEPGRGYPAAEFDGRVERFPFLDHTPPMLETMVAFCESAKAWLDAHERNVVALHCKAGKGRAGTMACCLMLRLAVPAEHEAAVRAGAATATAPNPASVSAPASAAGAAACAPAKSAADVIRFYDENRVTNNKGLTVPSQLIAVRYYEMAMRRWGAAIVRRGVAAVPPAPSLRLSRFELEWDTEHSPPDVLFRVTLGAGACRRRVFTSHVGQRSLDCGESLVLEGTVCVELFKIARFGKRKKLCILNLHTAFVLDAEHEPRADENGTVVFPKSRLDKLAKDKKNKKVPGQFHVLLTLEPYAHGVPASATRAAERVVPFSALEAEIADEV